MIYFYSFMSLVCFYFIIGILLEKNVQAEDQHSKSKLLPMSFCYIVFRITLWPLYFIFVKGSK
jgi:hypothetical protein